MEGVDGSAVRAGDVREKLGASSPRPLPVHDLDLVEQGEVPVEGPGRGAGEGEGGGRPAGRAAERT